jgi:hypothetical protein
MRLIVVPKGIGGDQSRNGKYNNSISGHGSSNVTCARTRGHGTPVGAPQRISGVRELEEDGRADPAVRR